MKEKRVRTDIVITPGQRRHIQMIQLEILIEIDRICRKHHIEYRLIGGSLIGAVRHKGFIPWDPDADISMNRADYNRFFAICREELNQQRFFLQEWRTDANYRWNYARMLRNGTEFVRAGHEELNAKNGVFVDIICADAVPDAALLRPVHCFACFLIRKLLWSKVGQRLHPNFLLRKWYALLALIPRDAVFKLRDWVISWSGDEFTELSRNMAHTVSRKSSSKWGYPKRMSKKEATQVANGSLPWDYFLVELEFEGHKFLVSKFYEADLRNTFGNYNVLPPVEERTSHIPCAKLTLLRPEIANFNELMKKVYI
jgi:lipopolysaccharide cholinephosphotransferase